MLVFFTIVLMLAVAYSYLKEGLFTAFTMAVNVFAAGLVAFNFGEPLADQIEPLVKGGFFEGYEDAFCLVSLFCIILGGLRWITNQLVNANIDYQPLLQQIGAGFFGLVTGYLVAGFMLCVLQTLPWQENFMNFESKVDLEAPSAKYRHVLPPDRVWLALMHRASEIAFSQTDGALFDDSTNGLQAGSFEIRFARYRRYNDSREPPVLPYIGELSGQ